MALNQVLELFAIGTTADIWRSNGECLERIASGPVEALRSLSGEYYEVARIEAMDPDTIDITVF